MSHISSSNQSYSSILSGEILKGIETILQKQVGSSYSTPNIQRTKLPTFQDYHLKLLNESKIEPKIDRLCNWANIMGRTKRQTLQAIQYHPFYHLIMLTLNEQEEQHPKSKSRPCFQILSGRFIPIRIRETILSRYSNLQLVKSIINISIDLTLPVNLFVITSDIWSDFDLLEVLGKVRLILTTIWILYRHQIRKTNSIQYPINIFFYPTKFKKKLPFENHLDEKTISFLKSEAYLAQKEGYQIGISNYETTTSVAEVNSAMCNNGKHKWVVIWREEDWTSRLCHELIHFYNLEKVELPNLGKYFAINNQLPVNPAELVTETQTYFLWTVFRGIMFVFSSQGNLKQQVDKWIEMDREHQIRVASRLLNYYKKKNIGDIKGGLSSLLGNDPNLIVNINSNAFYYYFMRGCIWIEIDDVVLDLLIPGRQISSDRLVSNLLIKMPIFDELCFSFLVETNTTSLQFYP